MYLRGRALAGVLGAAVLMGALAVPSVAAAALPAGFEDSETITGLTQPVGVEWAADGRAFIVEKHGVLKTAAPGASTATTVLDIKDQVNDFGDHGLETVAVDKSFATNGYVYLAYTAETLVRDSSTPTVSRVVRYTLDPATGQLAAGGGSPTILLGTHNGPCPTPANDVDCMPAESGAHMIGTVRSDPDGTLWVGHGDGAGFNGVDTAALRSLDPKSLAGKILHVDRDGKAVPGPHPFCAAGESLNDVCAKVHAKGFRNPYRFHVRPDKKVILGDVGWNTREEIDVIDGPGKSYGWPCREGKIATPGYTDEQACAPYTTSTETDPIYDYPRCTGTSPPSAVCGSSVIGGPDYQGDQYPAGYRGSMFVGDYTSFKILRLPADGNGGYEPPQVFDDSWLGTDLEPTPDGNLAYVNFGFGTGPDGYVGTISYTAGNLTPVASATADQTNGPAPLAVTFDGSGSSDPDDDQLTYDWDFGDGSAHGSGETASHTYTEPGTYQAKLTVSDGRGKSASKTITITAGGTAPVATIAEPTVGDKYRDGDQVQLRGSATDADQGQLPASALSWQVILHHGDHTHFDSSFPGVAEATFDSRRDHDADSYYEVRLTATDSQGLTDTTTVDITPETTTAQIESTPTGAPVSYGGRAGTAPFSQTTAIGYSTTATAAAAFTSGGRPFLFDRWSDGVTGNTRNLTVPETGVDLRALYLEDKSRGMPATASSTQEGNAAFAPSNAADGDGDTRWSSDGLDNQYWQVDLGRERTVDRVQIDWEAAYASRYQILTSVDGSTWDLAGETTQPASGSRTTTFTARVGRYVRVLGLERGTQYGLSFYEARVLGPADTIPPPTSLPTPAQPQSPTPDTPSKPAPKPSYAWTVMGTRGLEAMFGLGDGGRRAVDAKGGQAGRFLGSPRRVRGLTATGRDPSGRGFDGRNDRVELDPDSLGRPRAFTIELWLDAARTRRTAYVFTAAADRARDGFWLALDSRGRPVLSAAGTKGSTASRLVGPGLGTSRRHLVVTYHGRRLRLYVDGRLRETGAAGGLVWSRHRRLMLGADEDGHSPFRGTLDELALYDRALSATTVKMHSAAGR